MLRWIRWTRYGRATTRYPQAPPTPQELGLLWPQALRSGPSPARSFCPTQALQEDGSLLASRCLACGLCAQLDPEGYRMEVGFPPIEAKGPLPSPFRRSLHLLHFDGGSDGGEESELIQLQSPPYDVGRLGIFFTPTPRHADVLLVTGPVLEELREALLETYAAMPAPRWVVAFGTDAISGSLFAPHGVGAYLPVDLAIPGSPPSPLALLKGLLQLKEGR